MFSMELNFARRFRSLPGPIPSMDKSKFRSVNNSSLSLVKTLFYKLIKLELNKPAIWKKKIFERELNAPGSKSCIKQKPSHKSYPG